MTDSLSIPVHAFASLVTKAKEPGFSKYLFID